MATGRGHAAAQGVGHFGDYKLSLLSSILGECSSGSIAGKGRSGRVGEISDREGRPPRSARPHNANSMTLPLSFFVRFLPAPSRGLDCIDRC